jgi:NAD-dependent dihydropyrimidine dehydrogenase PreA subunit
LPTVTVDLEKCEGAGVCADVCPMNVYDMVEMGGEKKSQPTRQEDCIMCLACVNSCPTQAITVEE